MESVAPAHDAAPDVFRKLPGSAPHAPQNGVHLFDEFITEAPVASILDVRLGFRAENDRHDFRRFPRGVVSRALTSSQGRAASRSAS
jgi:hypothetical protein